MSTDFLPFSGRTCPRSTVVLAIVAALGAAFPVASAAPAPAPAKPAGAKPADKPAADKPASAKPASTPEPVLENVVPANPEEMVNKPQEFLGKNVKFTANFYAFSNLALDYKPAFKSSKTHLSFLVLKPNSHIPLSELKLAMMIPKEKDPESNLLASLKDGDQLEIVGKVYSAALDEPWVEVFKLKKLGASQEEKKTVASGADKDKDKEEAKTDKPAEEKPSSPGKQ